MTICEEYIGLMPVAQTNADVIVICIKDVLLLMNLRIQEAHGQCYDECLSMIETKNGAAAQIKKLMKCLLMHCYCCREYKSITFLKDTLKMAMKSLD